MSLPDGSYIPYSTIPLEKQFTPKRRFQGELFFKWDSN